ncbi:MULTISPECIES: xanthine dehydrogenase family protein molybdopterin-binding subunit [unclassified Bradyrhizobium]|uniref:xanthine dehydrogenase family protein molybdopterin-binding subunit n=1 Tax=unclassified Bradyrhizobium TaxID=2631580 RepID=UPI00211F127C|nr:MULTISPECIES: xanthine dehydrogenase family protein molybdopterin-binding subunit [unclassified Bradyrhizobium]MDD1532542.1 xanthine dehydrogenase [Bradyrhizobium sp. WBOS8]MDD1582546.1 xanthine dehydrogenase [Bradyrhizobium sp. WBOS4]UUO50817.1 xanthine dehydrogenase [Bradyrhizobium sp. WBOS04]UUO58194.1 xanthine dehydrogenase [Bradyrhizobium sp. WBOS08]
MTAAAPEPKANMGQPVPRYDAVVKVTGRATYASDMPLADPAYAFLVTSAIAKGRIDGFDYDEARRVRGVIDIVTHENAPKLKDSKLFSNGGYAGTTIQPLKSAEIAHDGQIIAVVVAETYEAAREAANRVKVSYTATTPSATFDSPGTTAAAAKGQNAQFKEDPKVGDFAKAFDEAEVKLTASYETPTQHHNPMELFSTSCAWMGDELVIYEPSQFVYGLKYGVAEQLGIDADKVRVVNPYVGGGFGARGSMTPRTAIIAGIAKRLNRPVKLVPTRDQGFTITTYRAETRHEIKLGARPDGKLVALRHEGAEVSSRPDAYCVGGTKTTTRLYACPNVDSLVSIVRADRNTPGFMRSPPEVPYLFALESAMDELAVKLNMDPVELRRINDATNEPIGGKPYTSRSLMACFDEAVKAFGWAQRSPQPKSMSDGDWLIGYGCAATCYPAQMGPAAARVRLQRDGRTRVEIAGHEIGTGAYTVIAQTAAERLGVPLEKVAVFIGDSDLPPAPVAGGSNSTASTCSVVTMVCDQIRQRLFKAVMPGQSLTDKARETVGIGQTPATQAAKGDQPLDLEKAFDALGVGVVEEYGEWKPEGAPPDSFRAMHSGQVRLVGGHQMKDQIAYAFGAEFVEVRVNRFTHEIRCPRLVGAFAAGRIMNPRTARSQLMGGLIWGMSSALLEATEIDERNARYVNDNLADYLVPVNADVADVEVILLSEQDDRINPVGVKGVGELGNVGTNAAICNAIYHATGQRIRKLPVRLENIEV